MGSIGEGRKEGWEDLEFGLGVPFEWHFCTALGFA